MTPELWQKIETVFQTAVELPPAERDSFLEMACHGDAVLFTEIQKLLHNLDSAENFIESPVWTDSVLLNSRAKKDISDSFRETLENDGIADLVGSQIGQYKLVREIGRGGMGAVFLAERADGEFRQNVAIKLIKRGMDSDYIVRRFRHERQILASFEHPFIARLLDGGTTQDGLPYFVMEYIEGETLYNYSDAKRLTIRDRLKIFQKVCSAIEYAHERQIIHRDIKPSNILINRSGSPKLLDFGIAKILDPDLIHESLNPTASMLRMMTPDYASPEQVCGNDVTPSSDIYSLGMLLYELLTGHRPYNFAGRALHEISRVICDVMPELPSVVIKRPENLLPKYNATKATYLEGRAATEEELESLLRGGLDDIVMKALAKEPAARYNSASELSKDISRHISGENISAPRYHPKQRSNDDLFLQITENGKAIAVLPFKFLSLGNAEDTDHKFLGLGLADALITRLSKVRRFVVRPTRSILNFTEGVVDPIRAGRDLGVDYILDGNIKKAGNRLRTSVQLLNVHDNAAVWATSIDETLSDVLTLEDVLANKVVEVLLPQLTGSELAEFSKRGTEVPEAFEHYIRGRYHFNSFTEEGLAKAFVSFHSAIAADPGYALAFAGIADYYNWLGIIGVLPPQECFQPAIEAATRAVELDESLAEAHASLGFSVHGGNYDWSRAEHHLRRAIELNPNNASAYVWYSIVLYTEARFDEGLNFARRSVDLDPLTPFNHHNVAWGLYYARRYDEAAARYGQMVQDFPRYNLAHYGLSKVHRIIGNTRQALEENQTALELTGNSIFARLAEAECLAADGQTEAARRKISELERLSSSRYVSPYQLALAYCYLHERDDALNCLEKAGELREAWLNWMGVEPVFDILRGDPRFDELLESVGYRIFFSNYSISSTRQPSDRADTAFKSGNGRLHDVTTLVIGEPDVTDGGTPSSPIARGSSRIPSYVTVAAIVAVVIGLSLYTFTSREIPSPNSPGAEKPVFESPAIVILPFISEDLDIKTIGVGLSDALASKLGGVRSINVLSASTGRSVAGQEPSAIARTLGVPYVLRGKIEREPAGELVTDAELINASSGTTVWSEQFTTSDRDLFGLQTQLSEKLLRALKVTPMPLERQQLYRRYTENKNAYELYLVGQSRMADRSRDNLHSSIVLFEQAVREDSNFALPYVGLADAYALLNTYDIEPPPDIYKKSREAALKALSIDESLAEAHASLAYIKFFHDRDRPGAELEFRRAIQLNPSYAQAHHWFALALAYMKRPVEALNEAQTAQRLDPRSPAIKTATGIVYLVDGKNWEAIGECENALALNPNFVPALKVERWAYTMLGDRDNSLASFERELKASGGSLDDPGWMVIKLQIDPKQDLSSATSEIEKIANTDIIRKNDESFAFEVALAFNAIGETSRALDYLERAEASQSHSFNLAEVDPRISNLRREPRFQRLINKLRQPLPVS